MAGWDDIQILRVVDANQDSPGGGELWHVTATPAEIEHALGLAPGDLVEFWPDGDTPTD